MKIKTLILFLSICATPLLGQSKYYVNATKGNDTNDGTSWSKAFATLQPALDKAVANDEIWVTAGTYLPTKNLVDGVVSNTSHPQKSFVLPKGVKLYGGFPASADDATGMSQRNWIAHPTILSGDFNDDDDANFGNMDENAYHVLIIIEGDAQTVVDGFTITGGNACGTENITVDNTPVYSRYGGGIYASVINGSKETSPILHNVIIEYNNALYNGGGFFNFAQVGEANPIITNAIIRNNKAGYSGSDAAISIGNGGGFFNSGVTKAAPILTNVIISGNDAEETGGGFYCESEQNVAAPVLTNVLINGNSAHDGAGMICYSYENIAPVLTSVTIVGNKATDEGGGFACHSVGGNGISSPEIQNSVIWGNKSDKFPNIYNYGATASTVKAHYSFIEGEPASVSAGNLDGTLNPTFVSAIDADFAPTTEGDYQLSKTSPLINKGKNDFILLTEDLAGKVRIVDGTVDIGAYEYPELGGGGPGTSNNEILAENTRIWAEAGNLYIKIEEPTIIRVYTVDGSLFRQINYAAEGTQIIPLPAGIYFVSLNDDTKAKIFVPLP